MEINNNDIEEIAQELRESGKSSLRSYKLSEEEQKEMQDFTKNVDIIPGFKLVSQNRDYFVHKLVLTLTYEQQPE